MTLRLSVDEKAWGDHVRRTVLALGDVMPVVKGNGYGFGRSVLMPHAAAIARDVAVGSVYELVDVPDAMRPFVLTPVGVGVDAAIGNTVRRDAVLTVAAPHDLQQLGRIGARNSVVVKLQSSMHRYGVELSGATALRTQAERLGHEVVAWSVHLPLAGSDTERVAEIASIASGLSTDIPLHVSHVANQLRRCATPLLTAWWCVPARICGSATNRARAACRCNRSARRYCRCRRISCDAGRARCATRDGRLRLEPRSRRAR